MKRSPLSRKTGMERKPPLNTGKSVAASGKKRRPPRETGPGVATRRLVATRAGGCCERCGKPITGSAYSMHHRKPRGMGGTSDPAINSPANLVLLCGSATTPDGCHTTVEKFRKVALFMGFIVRQSADPEAVPIKLIHGWFLLRPDGSRVPTERPQLEDGLDDD